jgi:hypothetical protein
MIYLIFSLLLLFFAWNLSKKRKYKTLFFVLWSVGFLAVILLILLTIFHLLWNPQKAGFVFAGVLPWLSIPILAAITAISLFRLLFLLLKFIKESIFPSKKPEDS